MTNEGILKEIKEVVDFTCSYWWPAYERAEEDITLTPAQPAIILDIIRQRSSYVRELENQLNI